jgi:hypothetical protein
MNGTPENKKSHHNNSNNRQASDPMTNKKFAAENAAFKDACNVANIPVTSRQASKWRRHLGRAWKIHKYGIGAV